jgi:hypothetical protein
MLQPEPARMAFRAWHCLQVRVMEFPALSRPMARMASPLLQLAAAMNSAGEVRNGPLANYKLRR